MTAFLTRGNDSLDMTNGAGGGDDGGSGSGANVEALGGGETDGEFQGEVVVAGGDVAGHLFDWVWSIYYYYLVLKVIILLLLCRRLGLGLEWSVVRCDASAQKQLFE